MEFPVRKIAVTVEEIMHDGGPVADKPRRRAAVMALVANPFAGRYVEDIQPGMDALKPLGIAMTERLIEAMGGDRDAIDAYGKGALVGTAGELEHGALWHVPGGYAMREALGESLAIVPSTKKVGGFGARLDVPIGHRNAGLCARPFRCDGSGIAGRPRPDEILFALVMASGPADPRAHGGLTPEGITVRDGQR